MAKSFLNNKQNKPFTRERERLGKREKEKGREMKESLKGECSMGKFDIYIAVP